MAKLTFFNVWRWSWFNDLDTQPWPRYGQDVAAYKKWSFYVNWFKSYNPNRHTHTHTHYENVTSTACAGGNEAVGISDNLESTIEM